MFKGIFNFGNDSRIEQLHTRLEEKEEELKNLKSEYESFKSRTYEGLKQAESEITMLREEKRRLISENRELNKDRKPLILLELENERINSENRNLKKRIRIHNVSEIPEFSDFNKLRDAYYYKANTSDTRIYRSELVRLENELSERNIWIRKLENELMNERDKKKDKAGPAEPVMTGHSDSLETLIKEWKTAFNDKEVPATEIFNLITEKKIGIDSGDKSRHSGLIRIGKLLSANSDRIFPIDNISVKIERSRRTRKFQLWRLKNVIAD